MSFETSREVDHTLLRIAGSLDALTAPELRASIDALVRTPAARIVVDLSALVLIDSSGVAALIGLYKRARATGGEVLVAGLRGQPLAIFKLLRLDRVLVR